MQHPLAFPSPSQGVWHLGPFPLRAYALMIILGIVVAVWLGERRWAARGGTPGVVIDIAVWAVPFGLIGGRLYHVITDNQMYFGSGRHPLDALKIWNGGLGIWGAVALGALGAAIGCHRRGVNLRVFADAVAPGIALAQGIGRWGNWFNQELYGRPTSLPWAVTIDQDHRPRLPDGSLDPRYADVANYHPTFLYESLWCFGIAILVIWAGKRYRLNYGRTFALYVAAYTVGRAWIEWLRIDNAHHFLGLRLNDYTALVCFVAAAAYLYVNRDKSDVEEVVETRDRAEPGGDETAGDPEPPSGAGAVRQDHAEPAGRASAGTAASAAAPAAAEPWDVAGSAGEEAGEPAAAPADREAPIEWTAAQAAHDEPVAAPVEDREPAAETADLSAEGGSFEDAEDPALEDDGPAAEDDESWEDAAAPSAEDGPLEETADPAPRDEPAAETADRDEPSGDPADEAGETDEDEALEDGPLEETEVFAADHPVPAEERAGEDADEQDDEITGEGAAEPAGGRAGESAAERPGIPAAKRWWEADDSEGDDSRADAPEAGPAAGDAGAGAEPGSDEHGAGGARATAKDAP